MNGIFGIWDRAKRAIGDEFHEAVRLLSHLGPSRIARGRGWAMAVLGEPAEDPRRGKAVVCIDGRIDEPGIWNGEPGPVRGDFAAAVFDPDRQHLSLLRDAVGIRPLYYAEDRGRFVFSTEIKAIPGALGFKPVPDETVLCDWLYPTTAALERLEETPFSGIYSLEPGVRAEITPNRTSRVSWDRLGSGNAVVPGDFPEAVSEFRRLFERAVSRRSLPGKTAVSVSGGLDSSSIYATAAVQGISPLGVSLGTGADTDEASFLDLLEIRFQRPIARIAFQGSTSDYARELSESVWHGELPFVDYLVHAQSELYRRMRDEGMKVALSGHWADELMHTPAYLVDLLRDWRWRELGRHLAELDLWFSPEECRHLKRRFALEAARSLVPPFFAKGLKAGRGLLSSRRNPAVGLRRPRRASWKLASRGPMATSHGAAIYLAVAGRMQLRTREWLVKSAARFGLKLELPFLDRDIIEFLLALPGSLKNHRGVPRAILREAMASSLPEGIRRRSWKSSYDGAAERVLAAERSRLLGLLETGEEAMARGYLAREALGRLGHGDLVEACGLALWCDQFFGNGGRGRMGKISTGGP